MRLKKRWDLANLGRYINWVQTVTQEKTVFDSEIAQALDALGSQMSFDCNSGKRWLKKRMCSLLMMK